MTAWTVPGTVRSVYDGDTLTVNVDLERLDIDLGWHITLIQRITDVVHVRLAHIDAPELGHPGGVEARDFLRLLLPVGAELTLTSHSLDKYGRTLGTIVTPNAADIGEAMIASGHAVPYEGGPR